MIRTVVIVVLCFFLSVVGKEAWAQPYVNEFDVKLAEMAASMNKKMPVTEGPYRMDSVGTRKGRVMVYNYTIMGSDKLKLDYLATKNSIEKKIIENLKTNPKLKSFKENDVTMVYKYFDEHGVKQIVIELKSSVYK
jgi:cell division protein FtsB